MKILEKELYDKIDRAPEEKVRNCLKIITSLWFVEGGVASFDKELNCDTFMAVTDELYRFGFCPSESENS